MSGCLLISILDPKISFTEQEGIEGASTENIFGGQTPLLTPYDLKRLESYSNNLVDYHLVRSFSLPFLQLSEHTLVVHYYECTGHYKWYVQFVSQSWFCRFWVIFSMPSKIFKHILQTVLVFGPLFHLFRNKQQCVLCSESCFILYCMFVADTGFGTYSSTSLFSGEAPSITIIWTSSHFTLFGTAAPTT